MRQNIFLVGLMSVFLVACGSGDDSSDIKDTAACSDGRDNDGDGLIDFPADAGCSSASDNSEGGAVAGAKRHRYAMANQCWAIQSVASERFVQSTDDGFAATASNVEEAEPFFMKPTALGKYLFYSSAREVLSADGEALSTSASASADDSAEWRITGVGDSTEYPPTPAYHTEPSPEQVAQWHSFVDPMGEFAAFTIYSAASDANLNADEQGGLSAAAVAESEAQAFRFEPAVGCADYPEASSDFSGVPFAGKTADGRVLGHADVHVHISSSEFLGGAQWGRPYHKFGVEHALGDCDSPEAHGPQGALDLLNGAFSQDTDGHATDGWPSFTEWPARDSLTHEAIYWRWLERSWASGLRVVVNDLVDNQTLCELQRNAKGDPTQDCNSMNNAGRQAGTMYGMENYIDAQYGGPGKGFFQIVHSPEEARAVIEDGKMAVVLGIEISNLFNCQLTYSPLRSQEPFEEDGSGGFENAYGCTIEEGQPNSILTQMQRIHDWGVRQVISIHEFDNAFGGNGIFDGMVLNLGNRENSGGIPSDDLALITDGDLLTLAENFDSTETPTGEFWTTYDCPLEDETPGFTGYLWGDSGGSTQSFLMQPACVPTGQGGRSGGSTPCYPAASQCNARWMTPAGLYTYGKLMEMGFVIDFDHMEVGMKTQLLELAEAQSITYPLVSTHGTFGGITLNQAERVLKGGGYLYPSNGSSRGFRNDLAETLGIYEQAFSDVPADQRPLFGFGYGTDTNGLSAQSSPRSNIEAGGEVVYPFSLFSGGLFDQLDDFDSVAAVVFEQPSSRDAEGQIVRTWSEDVDGNAHHGMISDFLQEVVLEGSAEDIQHVFNSAEVYLRTWQQSLQSSERINAEGLVQPQGILRPAPVGTPETAPYE